MQKSPFDRTHNQDNDRAVIDMAIETLTKIIESATACHAGKKWEHHVALLEAFDTARTCLDKLPDRNWEAEVELKSAYNGALDVLETSFNAAITEQRPR